MIVYGAWWSHEARVGDTFPTRNEFGRRFIDNTNGDLRTQVWEPMTRAASTSEVMVNTLKEVHGLPLAVAAFSEAYALVMMAEHFCDGTVAKTAIEPGPKMSTLQLLDLAIERFNLVRTETGSLTGNTEAAALATASLVGIARAHLFAGRKAEAATAARQVAPAFVFELKYVDDPANRGRTGNSVFNYTTSRQSLVVPPEYRAIADGGDTRIKYDDAGRLAQDSELRFFRQQKFPGWALPIRLASGLEARYIAAEASGDITEQLALIAERRTVGKQAVFTGTSAAAVLAELMDQRARDFWLEGKKVGDYRRNPAAVPFVPAPGTSYYKAGVGNIGTQTCWPVPDAEIRNNPNWGS
jgi:starch-binding outer membrane protein, SusD/RagB family